MATTSKPAPLKKFILFIRATPTTEDPASLSTPSPETQRLLSDMMHFNQQLIDAGVLLDADGFLPSRVSSARISGFSPSSAPEDLIVTKGPFDHATLVSGYCVIKAKDLEEAIDWARKIPFRTEESVVEVREANTLADFGDNVTEEVKQGEGELRKKFEEGIGE
ncbi:hypothetical protein V8F20_007968 [Naviculisporaceae sp. PSN 640]